MFANALSVVKYSYIIMKMIMKTVGKKVYPRDLVQISYLNRTNLTGITYFYSP